MPPPTILEQFDRLPSHLQTQVLGEFAAIDSDVETRVDTYLAQAVADVDEWHPKQALIGWAERHRAMEEVVPLMASVGSGVGLAIAQGAIVAAGVAAGAVSFGIIPVAGVLIGVGISIGKEEYQHYASTKRLQSGIKDLRAKRRDIDQKSQQSNQQSVPYADAGYLNELKSVMDEAGEKINRKYLRVARKGKESYRLRSGSPHTGQATAADRAAAAGLITARWKNGAAAKDDSMSLAVLELHFYASTIYQELDGFLNFISEERTNHLNKMTKLRGHIIRQMHIAGNHQQCTPKCGTIDMTSLEDKCNKIAQKIRAAAQASLDSARTAATASKGAYDALVTRKAQVEGMTHDAHLSRLAALQAQQSSLNSALKGANEQQFNVHGQQFNAQWRIAQNERREQLKATGLSIQQVEQQLSAAREQQGRDLAQVNRDLAAALAKMNTDSNVVSERLGELEGLKQTNLAAAGGYRQAVKQTGWKRSTISSQMAASELNKLKAEGDLAGEAMENKIVGAAVDYGLDVAMDQVGNVVEEVADKASNVATAVGVGAVLEFSIETLKDLYQNRQVVRRLQAFGRARDDPWKKLSQQAQEDAMKDLEKIGLDREKLNKIGQRVGHYLTKIASIDQQLAALQAQSPYCGMFDDQVYDNAIFSSCVDAMNAWHLCCYKDKQYAKLEASALAFQMLLDSMEKKLAGASHGEVVTIGTLIAKQGAVQRPSYFDKMD